MKWLKFYREKKGLSMQQLSDLINVKVNTIWRWENDRASPSVEIAQVLAKIFEITESELLNGPVTENWELKLITKKEATTMAGTIDLTGKTTGAALAMSDCAMGLTLSASYETWADDEKFEGLIEELRKKRAIGLKLHKEEW